MLMATNRPGVFMRNVFLIAAMYVFLVNNSGAQHVDLGSWNILNVKYNVDQKWSVFGEAQLRSLKFYDHFHYYEYKGGITCKVHNNAAVSIGAGSYQTYKEGGDFVRPKNNNEFRIWPQLILLQSLGKIKIEQRYRAELRFTSNGYRNRFRYRLAVSYPFGKERQQYKPFQISTSNELFFTDKEPYFERNRIQVAFHYKPSKSASIQVGYLHQFDYRINDETGRDFLQIGYFLEFSRKKLPQSTAENDLKDN
jgi:hypothetical protein